MKPLRLSRKVLLTSVVVAAAACVLVVKYRQYMVDPWTRDGQVRANVIQIAPRVSGPLVNLPIADDQFVHKGDLLFAIDPRTYQAALDQAKANLDKTRDQIKNLVGAIGQNTRLCVFRHYRASFRRVLRASRSCAKSVSAW